MATLFGRYEYAGELGQGASGRVFAVLDRAAEGARRAIKVVPAADSGRLVWEFARLCQVEHPRLARVRELVRLSAPAAAPFALPRGTLLLVEDYVDGAPLSRVLADVGAREDGPRTATRSDPRARRELAARVVVSVAEALGALHEASLVHGDVKPDNVLCGPSGQGATLIDLGFARPPALASVPRGTPAYMAPELFAGVCTPAADVYALGALLYDCLRSDAQLPDGPASSSRSLVPWRVRDLRVLALPESDPLLRVLASLLASDHTKRPADGRAALSLLLPSFAQLGVDLERTPLEYAGAGLVHSAGERAARARTQPFVGHAAALAKLRGALDEGGWVRVRGPHGAGRSRLIREAIRLSQEQRAASGQSVPTWVSSLPALSLLRDVDAILWLDEQTARDVAAIERAEAAATLAVNSLCVVIECEPESSSTDSKVGAWVDVGALAAPEFGVLLERLFAPDRPASAVVAAARARSLGLSGRLCELVSNLLLTGRDVRDARVFEAAASEPTSASLTHNARTLAVGLAWFGSLLSPDLAARWVGDAKAARAAYDELRSKGLLALDDSELALAPTLARRLRNDAPPTLTPLLREELSQRCEEAQRAGASASGLGFLRIALDERPSAAETFVRQALGLRAEGRNDAACELLAEAADWVEDGSLRVLWADSERARGRYLAALTVLEPVYDAAARLLRAELLRMSEQAARARRELSDLEVGAEGSVVGRIEALRARLAFDAGELVEARTHAARARASGDREAEVRALEVEVLVHLTTGELASAPIDALIASASASLPGAAKAGASFLTRAPARALSLRAQLRTRRGQRAGALSDLRAAVEQTRALGEAHEEATYALNLGLLELEQGELGRAREALREAAQRLAQVARTRDLARVLFNFAVLLVLVGDFERADAVLTESERELAGTPDYVARALFSVVRAELSLSRGELESAERVLVDAIAALPEQAGPVYALLSARAVQVALARGSLPRADVYLQQARAATAVDDVHAELELTAAELRSALARGDLAAAHDSAQRGFGLLHEGVAFAERVRFMLAALEATRAGGNAQALAEQTSLLRAWLERALSTLPGELRAKLRVVPAYARVLASADAARSDDASSSQDPSARAGSERWRTLVRASRRLFGETRAARIAQRLTEIALELVHAERALVLSFDERGELGVLAESALSGESERARGFSRSVVERVALDRRPLLTVEAAADARLDRAQSVAALEVRSVLCGELFGLPGRAFLYLDDRLRPSAFGADDLALIEDLVELARQALRTGEELQREARRARRAEQQQKRLRSELTRGGEARAQETSALPLIGDSAILARVIATARRVATSDAPLLITGESGTGKELLARFVHDASPRRTRAFVAESCAAIPDTLLESALFGHVRGAFTGADRAHKGLFEAADGGTLFLDEVGEMSASLQGKLLRVLQEGELRPVGSERTRVVDVRVLGATRRDLLALVADGRFREDLYYRLAVVTLELPPLRDRPEDVAQLVSHFLDKHGRGRSVRVAPGALRELASRPWPGNVRELENEVRRALAFSDSDSEIELEHLTTQEPVEAVANVSELDLHAHTDRLSRKLVREALSRAEGNVTRAAVLLGVSRFGLQKILKRLQLSAK
ncbi:MAG: hypothetical protein RLZZ450_2228 [Pseudomonadota bacterium]|jgi:transcriptional regulator with GAF, ATPase, and Fis domain